MLRAFIIHFCLNLALSWCFFFFCRRLVQQQTSYLLSYHLVRLTYHKRLILRTCKIKSFDDKGIHKSNASNNNMVVWTCKGHLILQEDLSIPLLHLSHVISSSLTSCTLNMTCIFIKGLILWSWSNTFFNFCLIIVT